MVSDGINWEKLAARAGFKDAAAAKAYYEPFLQPDEKTPAGTDSSRGQQVKHDFPAGMKDEDSYPVGSVTAGGLEDGEV
ncbi:hypothetical protein DL764_009106 [Monosporascus ibericus]|uniref:Uncharacterized protein n=1 Tax=Monosporascus ibericus TaxID=155417 RepID=A0A4Q4SY06_9PEZI|nr:hypothetical protein DL764_009106 [Monosporascus ibericus]